MNAPLKVNGFIAAHISSQKSVGLLCAALQSVYIQSKPLSLLCISWSADQQFRSEVRAVFRYFCNEFRRISTTIIVLQQAHRCQQFQHYQLIYQHLSNRLQNDELVIFGDADDVWATDRVYFMHAEAQLRQTDTVVFNWKFEMFDYGFMRKFTLLYEREKLDSFEYWMVATRFHVFASFFVTLKDPRYLESPFCDLAFDSFLLKQPLQHARLADDDEVHGLYYYGGAHNNGGFAVTGKEVSLKFLEGQLMEAYPKSLTSLTRLDHTGYQGFLGRHVIINDIGIDELYLMKAGTVEMSAYVRYDQSGNRSA